MPWDYALIATDCPPLVIHSALHDPESLTPAVLFSQQPGVPATLTTGLRRNAVLVENVARYGGGAYAICEGLELEPGTGLTVHVTPGVAMLDGPIVKPAVSPSIYAYEDLAVTASVRNWIWLTHTGTFIVVATALTAPSGRCVCLGSVLMGASAITGNPDGSGRYMMQPFLRRRTGDSGTPSDTPDARASFFSRSNTGRFLWDGDGWSRIDNV